MMIDVAGEGVGEVTGDALGIGEATGDALGIGEATGSGGLLHAATAIAAVQRIR
ncbi:MAG: hypothetical protein ACRDGI_00850 [Candidatus Limnocylindrales bacterium]